MRRDKAESTAATTVQKNVRSRQAKREVATLRERKENAELAMAEREDALMSRQEDVESINKAAATKVQAAYRGKAGRVVAKDIGVRRREAKEQQGKAATRVQSIARGRSARAQQAKAGGEATVAAVEATVVAEPPTSPMDALPPLMPFFAPAPAPAPAASSRPSRSRSEHRNVSSLPDVRGATPLA